jgi:hypothetical protein
MSSTVEIDRVALAELADYARDDIVMHGLGDDDLEQAVRDAYGALDHGEDLLPEGAE